MSFHQAWVSRKSTLLPLLVMFLLTLFYGRPLLNLDPTMILSGIEVEWTLETDLVAWQSVRQYGELPLWHPYWHTGRPLLADPFFHGLDPKMFLPEALFGVLNGFKLGVWLSFPIMGLGGWWLGRVMGLGRLASGWLSIMLALNGHLVAYFTGVASVGLGLSYSYVPWVIAASLALWQAQSPRRVAAFAIAVALLFLGSNFYFFAYTTVALTSIVLAEGLYALLLRRDIDRWRAFSLHAGLGSLLAFALAAIVALPQLELFPYLSKPPLDPTGAAGQPVGGLLLNFLMNDPLHYESSPYNPSRFMIGHYSYVGVVPLFLLLLVPLAWKPGNKRPILWLASLGLLAMSYAAGTYSPLWTLYEQLPGSLFLRFPERALGLTTVALLALAALALDAAWRWSDKMILDVAGNLPGPRYLHTVWRRNNKVKLALSVSITGEWTEWSYQWRLAYQRLMLVLLAGLSIIALYRGNAPHLSLRQRDPLLDTALQGVKAQAGGRAFHLFVPANFSNLATSGSEVGQLNGTITWALKREDPFNLFITMHRAAEYALVWDGTELPALMGPATRLTDWEGVDFYAVQEAVPYAFTTSLATSPWDIPLSPRSYTVPVVAKRLSPRRILLQLDAPPDSRLVLIESNYPGWKVSIDGVKVPLEPFNDFLSVRTVPGKHEYLFYFDPWLPKLALLISLLTLPYLLWLLLMNRWGPGPAPGAQLTSMN